MDHYHKQSRLHLSNHLHHHQCQYNLVLRPCLYLVVCLDASSGSELQSSSSSSEKPSPSSSGSTLLPIPSLSVSNHSVGSNGKASFQLRYPSPSISVSHTLYPSPSKSNCFGKFELDGQLSASLRIPSPSISGSQASPIPSPSVSSWPGLAVVGQLSLRPVTPSLSGSFWLSAHPSASTCAPCGVSGHRSTGSFTPSPSASPFKLIVLLVWVVLAVAAPAS